MEKVYNIDLQSNKESNDFLRCLWARIRSNYGQLAWQLIPLKLGNKKSILIGYADFGLNLSNAETVFISCTYSSKGCLKTLRWSCSSLPNPKEFGDKFELCIKEAKEYNLYLKEFSLKVKLESEVCYYLYNGARFSIIGDELCIRIKAYDKVDYTTFFSVYANLIKSLLSFDCLKYIGFKNSGIEKTRRTSNFEILTEHIGTGKEEKHIFNFTSKLKNISISKYIADYIDEYLIKDIDYENPYDNFERSVLLFSQGLMFEELTNTSFRLDFSIVEYVIVCYMSSLEIITIDDTPPIQCKECGQNKYSIAKRVKQLAKDAVANDFFSKLISDFYNSRSKFVHTGGLLTNNTYIGISTPLLSEKSSTGLIGQIYKMDPSITEMIKECILWHQKNTDKLKS